MVYKSILETDLVLTPERKQHILIYHPDIKPYLSKLKEVFLEPDDIRVSTSDKLVLLFYKYFDNILDGKYIVGVIKIEGRSFVLTAYLSNKKLSGEKYVYEKKS